VFVLNIQNKNLFEKTKKMIIANGIKNLHEFGYEMANEENIMTDFIYVQMFKRMLESNKGEDDRIDHVIDAILLDMFNRQTTNKPE
jgi:hypothetical protein